MATISVLLNASMGAASTILAPLLLGAYTDSGLFSEHRVAWLVSADFVGILISSTSAYYFVHKLNWQLATISALCILLLVNSLASQTSQFESLMLLRFIAGLACGVSYAIALAASKQLTRPHQAFSTIITIQIIFGTLGFFVLPTYIKLMGFEAVFHYINTFLLLTLVISFIAYPTRKEILSQKLNKIQNGTLTISLAFSSIFVYYLAQGMLWSYFERIGISFSITSNQVSEVLGMGFALSAIGSIVSAYCIEKWGYRFGLIATLLIQISCLFGLFLVNKQNAYWVFILATIIYQVLWSFVVPIFMDIFNKADDSGNKIVLCIAAFKCGFMFGPPIASLLIVNASHSYILLVGSGLLILSISFAYIAQSKLANIS